MTKRFFVVYESDRYNRMRFNLETDDYGSYDHDGGNASTLRSAKSVIRNIRRDYADESPRNFRVYDSYAEIDIKTGFVPCVYAEN